MDRTNGIRNQLSLDLVVILNTEALAEKTGGATKTGLVVNFLTEGDEVRR